MTIPLHVLMIEDCESDAALIVRQLARAGYTVNDERVETPDQLRAALSDTSWDIIIADYQLPQFDAQTALTLVQSTGLDIPFIVVSGAIGEETAVSLMRSGARDYLMKSNLARLAPAVKRELSEADGRRKRRQAEELLRLQSAALNAAANAIVITGRDGKVQWVNPAFTSLTGFTSDEALGQRLCDLEKMGTPDRDFFQHSVPRLMAGEVWHGERVNHHKEGREYTKEQTITPLFNADGQIVNFIAIMQDITERKQSEQALRFSRERYRYLVELSPDTILVLRNDSIEFANPAAIELFGATSAEQLIGKSVYELFHPDYHPIIHERIRLMTEARQIAPLIEEKIIRLDGNLRDVEATSAPFTDSTGDAIQVILRDITARKQAEERLSRSEQLLSEAQRIAHIGSWEWNIQADTMVWSEELCRIFNIDPPGPTNPESDHLQMIHPSDRQRLSCSREEALSGHNPFNTDYRITLRNGVEKYIHSQAELIHDSHGVPILLRGVAQDITDRKRSEQALQKSSEELQAAYEATLQGWSTALELRERETAGHSQRVVRLTLDIAHLMGIRGEDLIHIQRGALLHDIGKMGIPDRILLKPEPLTEDDWAIMHQHPVYAYKLLSRIPYLLPALDIPYCHHERWDGSGYPRGLKGEEIPLTARIFAVIDVWDALSSDRPYRPAWSKDAILSYLRNQAGKQFDPKVVEVFLNHLGKA